MASSNSTGRGGDSAVLDGGKLDGATVGGRERLQAVTRDPSDQVRPTLLVYVGLAAGWAGGMTVLILTISVNSKVLCITHCSTQYQLACLAERLKRFKG